MSGGIAFSENVAWMVGSSPIHAVLKELKMKCDPSSALYRKADRGLETMLLFIDISDLPETDFNQFADCIASFYKASLLAPPVWNDRIKDLLAIIRSDSRFSPRGFDFGL